MITFLYIKGMKGNNTMLNKELDFSPELGNAGRKRPLKSFTLSAETVDELKKMQKFHPEINVSNWVDNILKQALKENMNPALFVGYRKGFKPITLMLKAEVVDFINALMLTGGHGLGMANKVTPLGLGEKISSAILNSSLFLSGDMTVRGRLDFEKSLANATDNIREMYKSYKSMYDD